MDFFKMQSEAFPEPVIFWERDDGTIIKSDSSKYKIDTLSDGK